MHAPATDSATGRHWPGSYIETDICTRNPVQLTFNRSLPGLQAEGHKERPVNYLARGEVRVAPAALCPGQRTAIPSQTRLRHRRQD